MAASTPGISTSVGLLVLRVGFGAYMASHGFGKVQMLFAGQGEQFGDLLGLGPTLSLACAAGSEFLGALLVALGALTRVAALSVAFTMGVAAFLVHGSDPWTMSEAARLVREQLAENDASKEPALLFGLAFLALVFTGPGRFSIDQVVWSRKRGASGPAPAGSAASDDGEAT